MLADQGLNPTRKRVKAVVASVNEDPQGIEEFLSTISDEELDTLCIGDQEDWIEVPQYVQDALEEMFNETGNV